MVIYLTTATRTLRWWRSGYVCPGASAWATTSAGRQQVRVFLHARSLWLSLSSTRDDSHVHEGGLPRSLAAAPLAMSRAVSQHLAASCCLSLCYVLGHFLHADVISRCHR